MKKTVLICMLWICCLQIAAAQQQFVFDNRVYKPQIKTVSCYNSSKEQSIPVITLGSSDKLLFSFDDLNGGSKNYWYTVEHCTFDWKSSGLSPLDYLENATEDRIIDYAYSSKTLQKFTHYSLTLPNDQIRPKISGNYLIKVYENEDTSRPVCSQRFYVSSNQVNTTLQVTPSTDVALRFSNQKINATIAYTMAIQNPNTDVKLVIMQNADPLTAKLNTKPDFVKPGALVYNDISANDFAGGNEWRKFDSRSLRFKGEHVQNITADSISHITLFQDANGNAPKYTQQIDENGAFFIRNQDNLDNDTDSDYGRVEFTLNTKTPEDRGDVYIVGRFNGYQTDEGSRLNPDPGKKKYTTSLLLKQGVYDYRYVWKDSNGKVDYTVFEGSFFETENDYQSFVYYRRPGARWDELIGYNMITNIQR